ncbi:transglycosylase domain-containing protein [Curtobacterium ammoniigenes]|uniref:transglycosylase domain-containing protein n=1 Tax=Curtobacterium ammoniigenes TaxID=395387 RepID=UPI00082EEA54|nr:transglycosylase domain-containing protein [Curtobacterium ammoniigenes]
MRVLRWPASLISFVIMAVLAGMLIAVAVTPAVAIAGQGVSSAAQFFEGLPSYLDIGSQQQVSTIYASKGGQQVPIASFYAENRTTVPSTQMSKYVKEGAVDTEDPRFYEEGGIDLLGTVRGALSTASGSTVQGGSSITQQYVKNVLVQQCEQLATTAEINSCYVKVTGVTPQRKLQEMRYAIAVNKKYTKDQILTGYLNIVGLGGRVYGVEAAAEYYFGVHAADLTLPQAATLVAILNNPENLRIDEPSNASNGAANGYKLTKTRRDYVLRRMVVHHSITKAEADAAIATPITPKVTATANGCSTAATNYDAGYFCDYVRAQILQDKAFGATLAQRIETLDTKGLKVYTTLDLDVQAKAQAALSSYVPATMSGVHIGGSNVTVEPGTGRILSMVQNTAYTQSDNAPAGSTAVNYSADSGYGNSIGFQTGSTFKVFTLAEWLATGHTLSQYVSTTEHNLPSSEFHNSCENIAGPPWSVANAELVPASMSVLTATAESINTAFAQMGKQLDLCQIANLAAAMGIHRADGGKFVESPSMILGVNELSPINLAEAYAGFANDGVVCTPSAIDKVTEADGTVIAPSPSICTRGVSTQVAGTVDYALQTVLQPGGTAASANPQDATPKFAKTGTTDSDIQNWLVTSTTKYTNATWIGNVYGNVGLANWPMGQGTTGYSAKFGVGKQMMTFLDSKYGGGALPVPDQAMIGTPPAPPSASTAATATQGAATPSTPTTSTSGGQTGTSGNAGGAPVAPGAGTNGNGGGNGNGNGGGHG